MAELYPIHEVPLDAPLNWEQMGSKEKFWFQDPQWGKCLFKTARDGTGEDWAEKVVAELCALLGLPHATYDLARWNGKRGVVSPRFVPSGAALIHGNELLGFIHEDYPRTAPGDRAFCRVPQHTVGRVLGVLSNSRVHLPDGWSAPEGIRTAPEVFTGYLLLDAWVGNTDRHHENWGFIAVRTAEEPHVRLHLAPTFDHASSLARELGDEQRAARMSSADKRQSAAAYASRARSALFRAETDRNPLGTLEAFLAAARRFPEAATRWVEILGRIQEPEIRAIFDRVPGAILSAVASAFGLALLSFNGSRIRTAMEELS